MSAQGAERMNDLAGIGTKEGDLAAFLRKKVAAQAAGFDDNDAGTAARSVDVLAFRVRERMSRGTEGVLLGGVSLSQKGKYCLKKAGHCCGCTEKRLVCDQSYDQFLSMGQGSDQYGFPASSLSRPKNFSAFWIE